MRIEPRRKVLTLLTTVPALLVAVTQSAPVQSQGKKPKPAFGRVAAISKDARVERGGKPIARAKKGFLTREGDLLKSGAKAELDLFLGTLATYRLRAKTTMRLSKVSPPLPKEDDKVTVETRLDDGSVLLRTRKLGGQSKFLLRTKEALTAIGGTAYRVRWNDSRKLSSILVAEGQVAVSKPGAAPGTETLVDARKKVVVSATGVGEVADAGPEDEAEIQELLQLRLPGEPAAPVADGGVAPLVLADGGAPGGLIDAQGQPFSLASYAGAKVDAMQRRLGAFVSEPGEPADSFNNVLFISQPNRPEVIVRYSPATLNIRQILVTFKGSLASLSREEKLRMVGVDPARVSTTSVVGPDDFRFDNEAEPFAVTGLPKGWGVGILGAQINISPGNPRGVE